MAHREKSNIHRLARVPHVRAAAVYDRRNRKPHLQRLDLVFERSPIYFVTACMQDRRRLLATAAIHETFLRFAREGPARGAWVGAYVLIPDHLHLFLATPTAKLTLSDWITTLNNTLT